MSGTKKIYNETQKRIITDFFHQKNKGYILKFSESSPIRNGLVNNFINFYNYIVNHLNSKLYKYHFYIYDISLLQNSNFDSCKVIEISYDKPTIDCTKKDNVPEKKWSITSETDNENFKDNFMITIKHTYEQEKELNFNEYKKFIEDNYIYEYIETYKPKYVDETIKRKSYKYRIPDIIYPIKIKTYNENIKIIDFKTFINNLYYNKIKKQIIYLTPKYDLSFIKNNINEMLIDETYNQINYNNLFLIPQINVTHYDDNYSIKNGNYYVGFGYILINTLIFCYDESNNNENDININVDKYIDKYKSIYSDIIFRDIYKSILSYDDIDDIFKNIKIIINKITISKIIIEDKKKIIENLLLLIIYNENNIKNYINIIKKFSLYSSKIRLDQDGYETNKYESYDDGYETEVYDTDGYTGQTKRQRITGGQNKKIKLKRKISENKSEKDKIIELSIDILHILNSNKKNLDDVMNEIKKYIIRKKTEIIINKYKKDFNYLTENNKIKINNKKLDSCKYINDKKIYYYPKSITYINNDEKKYYKITRKNINYIGGKLNNIKIVLTPEEKEYINEYAFRVCNQLKNIIDKKNN